MKNKTLERKINLLDVVGIGAFARYGYVAVDCLQILSEKYYKLDSEA